MDKKTQSPLGKGPYETVEVEHLRHDIYDAGGSFLAIIFEAGKSENYDPAAVARLFAASWSFYQAAKLRAEYLRMNDQFEAEFGDADGFSPEQEPLLDAISAAGKAWLAMEAEAMAIAEGRALPATQDAEGR